MCGGGGGEYRQNGSLNGRLCWKCAPGRVAVSRRGDADAGDDSTCAWTV